MLLNNYRLALIEEPKHTSYELSKLGYKLKKSENLLEVLKEDDFKNEEENKSFAAVLTVLGRCWKCRNNQARCILGYRVKEQHIFEFQTDKSLINCPECTEMMSWILKFVLSDCKYQIDYCLTSTDQNVVITDITRDTDHHFFLYGHAVGLSEPLSPTESQKMM
eukprot:UN32836